MNKRDVQKRVTQHGKPLALSKFSWCEKTLVFSTKEHDCVIDFSGVDGVTIISGDCSTQTAGNHSTQTAGNHSTQTAGNYSTQTADNYSNQTAGWDSNQTAGWDSNQTAGSRSTQTAGYGSTHICNGDSIAIVRQGSVFDMIKGNKGDVIQSCPCGVAGFIVNGLYNGKPHIIADGILSEIVHTRGNIRTVINHGQTKKTYLIEQDGVFAHGDTVKKAQDALLFKTADRDTSQYEGLKLDTVKTPIEWAVCYSAITGACQTGTEYFMEKRELKETYTLAEILEETKGQYQYEAFKQFFTRKR